MNQQTPNPSDVDRDEESTNSTNDLHLSSFLSENPENVTRSSTTSLPAGISSNNNHVTAKNHQIPHERNGRNSRHSKDPHELRLSSYDCEKPAGLSPFDSVDRSQRKEQKPRQLSSSANPTSNTSNSYRVSSKSYRPGEWMESCNPGLLFILIFVILAACGALLYYTSAFLINPSLLPMINLLSSPNNYYISDTNDDGLGPNQIIFYFCSYPGYTSIIQQFNNNPDCYYTDFDTSNTDSNTIICYLPDVYQCIDVNDTFNSYLKLIGTSVVSSLMFVFIYLACIIWLLWNYINVRIYPVSSAHATTHGTSPPSTQKTSLLSDQSFAVQNPMTSVVSQQPPPTATDNTRTINSSIFPPADRESHSGEGDFRSRLHEDPDYHTVLTIKNNEKKLYGFIPVTSKFYAQFTLVMNAFSVISLVISIATSNDQALFNMISILFSYVLVSYVAIPIWQNYSIVQKGNTSEQIYCEDHGGCVLCLGCCSIAGQLCISGVATCHTRGHIHTPSQQPDCLFLPYSQYNLWFMIQHPGQELNPSLPENIHFLGFGRVYMMLLALNTRGTLNYFIFSNAMASFIITICIQRSFSVSLFFAMISLLSSIYNLRVYLLTSIYGFALIPYTFCLSLFFWCPDPYNYFYPFLQVSQESWLYSLIRDLWKNIEKFQ